MEEYLSKIPELNVHKDMSSTFNKVGELMDKEQWNEALEVFWECYKEIGCHGDPHERTVLKYVILTSILSSQLN